MAVPEFQAFIRPVLDEASRGPVATRETIARVVSTLGLSPEDLEEVVASGARTKVYDRVQWAATYLAQAGLVSRPKRGVIEATDTGRQVLLSGPDLITRTYLLEHFQSFREFIAPSGDSSLPVQSEALTAAPANLTPEDTIRLAHRQISDDLADQLLASLVAGSPAFFEHTIRELLVNMGYGSGPSAANVVGGSGDDGVDGVVNLDALGVDQVYFQAKRYQIEASIGPGALRDFFGALALKDVTKGIFATTARFSDAARTTAEKLSKRIVLIDGQELARLLIRYSVGYRVRLTYAISEIEEDYFE